MSKKLLVLGLLVSVAGSWILPLPRDVSVQAHTSQEMVLPGLDATVTVYFDSWGVPHVYAETSHDLFMVQGYLEAQQRFWQMDWWRRLSSGHLAELIGPAGVDSDRMFRVMQYDRAAEADLELMSDEAVSVLEAYSAGVNAYLEDKSPAEVAAEYAVLKDNGITVSIDRWQPIDTVRWFKVTAANFSENFQIELARQELRDTLGPLVEAIIPPYPYDRHPVITEPGGIDYTGASAAPQSQRPPFNAATVLPSGYLARGSNSWVISGDLTDTGYPYLANDPHISIQQPSNWFEVGLHCVELSAACPYDIAGFSVAGLPGIFIGHNRWVAWGLTNVGADVQDLYLLTVNPDDRTQYRYNDTWIDFETRMETIDVAGEEPVELTTRYSVWGPVINDAVSLSEDVLALRWTGYDGTPSVDALLQFMQARNWDEFRNAARLFDVPIMNIVYADVDGNIGYLMPGKIPVRAEGHDGKVPVDGSSDRYAWQGYVPFEELPHLYNPEAGYIVTANNRVVGPEYPYPIIDVYSYGWRAARIEAMIQNDGDGVFTLAEMQQMQGDNYNLKADFLIPAIQNLALDDHDPLIEAVEWLGGWDRQNDMHSGHAALFEAFWMSLLELGFADDLGGIPAGGGDLEWYLVSLFIERPDFPLWDSQLTPDEVESRDDILEKALRAAWAQMSESQGDDPSAWRWGDAHVATFNTNLLRVGGLDEAARDVIEARFNVRIGVGGGNSIVNATGWNADRSFAVTSIPSMRQILSLADWDDALHINPPGQSGNPDSANYRDQVEMWAEVAYRQMPFTPAAVEDAAEAVWIFKPQS
ncbi:MAG: penicillin acylase family protein [Chloroflexi bacterium]|nr:penicillin acylase family protein [Chloroflexota bacterium]